MRILHFMPSLDPAGGGPVRTVLDLCLALSERGHECTVMTTDMTGAPGWDKPGQPRLAFLGGPSVRVRPFSGAQRAKARELIASHDVVHVPGVWEMSNAQIGNDARRLGKPYVVSLHGMLDDWCMQQGLLKKRVFMSMFTRACLEKAGAVHCNGAGGAGPVEEVVPAR